MVDMAGGLLAGAGGLFALFGGIALLMWIDSRTKAQERQLAHAERMKALEKGQPLPDADVARANATASRAWAAGVSAVVITLGMGGLAVGATSLVFRHAEPGAQLPLLAIVWGVCGLIGLIAVSVGFASVAAASAGATKATPTTPSGKHPEPNSTAFREASARDVME